MRSHSKPLHTLLRTIISVLGIISITLVTTKIGQINAPTIGFAYLLFVLLIASTWGFIEAAVSSLVATLCFNYFFLPPIGTLTIADPANWIALFSFLASSLIASRLSAKAERRAMDARERQNDIERLYSFSRAILLRDESEPVGKQLASKLAESFELRAVVLFDRRSSESYYSGPEDLMEIETQLREAALRNTLFSDPTKQLLISSVRLGSDPIASLALRGVSVSDSVLQNISNLVAISLERARVQELAAHAETTRQTEQLRMTLIDATAHEFKTPLTSIKAATTALLAMPEAFPRNSLEIIKIADEETDRLKELVDETVEMSRLEMDRVMIDLEPTSISELIEEVVHAMRASFEDRPLQFDCPRQAPLLTVDQRLIKIAIRQLLDNALKYSPTGSSILVRVLPLEHATGIEVINSGEGISEEEQPRLFERFYRGRSDRQLIPGLGLGLSIVKRIASLHQGELAVASRPGETTFTIRLPMGSQGQSL